MSIHIDETGWLEMSDDLDPVLCTYLGLDVGDDPYKCLVVLYHVAQIAQRRSVRQAIGGESVSVALTPKSVIMEDHFAPERGRSIPFAGFKSAVEELWGALYQAGHEDRPSRVFRPDLTPAEGAVVMWEETFKQRHPYRGRIEGIPARGLE